VCEFLKVHLIIMVEKKWIVYESDEANQVAQSHSAHEQEPIELKSQIFCESYFACIYCTYDGACRRVA